jgi:hypothetical protein
MAVGGMGQYATDIGSQIQLQPGSDYANQLALNQLNQLPTFPGDYAAASWALRNPAGGVTPTPTFDLGSWLAANSGVVVVGAILLAVMAIRR